MRFGSIRFSTAAGEARWLAAIAVPFVLSRLLCWGLGLRFDVDPLRHFWQYLDPLLLRTRLGESLLHLHSQPPLYNLFLGLVLKAAPGLEAAAFSAIYIMLGLGLALALFALMRRMGVAPALALSLTLGFSLSPAALLYESYLFYTYPLAALLCFAALSLHRYLAEGRTRDGALFFGLVGSAVLMKGLFHLAWLLAIVAVVAACRRAEWRRVLLLSGLPVVLALGWYAKNLVLFGSFTGSSWLGMNLARVLEVAVPEGERRELASAGVVTELATKPAFRALEEYGELRPRLARTGVPALDDERKSTGPANFNHLAYVDLSRRYLADDAALIQRAPAAYLRAVAFSHFFYLLPATDYPFARRNLDVLRVPIDLYDRFVYGRPSGIDQTGGLGRFALGLAVGIPVLLCYGLAPLIRPGSGRRTEAAFRGTLLFMWSTAVYVMLVGNALEIGENNRFRFETDPVFVVLLGLLLTDLWQRLRPPPAMV
jgi:hypothetical protein